MIFLHEVQRDLSDKIELILTDLSQSYKISLVRAPVIASKLPEEETVPATYLTVEDISSLPYFFKCDCKLFLRLSIETGESTIANLVNDLDNKLRTQLSDRNHTTHTDYIGDLLRVSQTFVREENVVSIKFEFEVKGIEHTN